MRPALRSPDPRDKQSRRPCSPGTAGCILEAAAPKARCGQVRAPSKGSSAQPVAAFPSSRWLQAAPGLRPASLHGLPLRASLYNKLTSARQSRVTSTHAPYRRCVCKDLFPRQVTRTRSGDEDRATRFEGATVHPAAASVSTRAAQPPCPSPSWPRGPSWHVQIRSCLRSLGPFPHARLHLGGSIPCVPPQWGFVKLFQTKTFAALPAKPGGAPHTTHF